MTAIVGLVCKGKVWLGADSAGVRGNSIERRRDSKVFSCDEFAFGSTWSFRMHQLLQYNFTPPPPQEGIDQMRYMVAAFVPAVRQAFRDGGCLTVDKGKEEGGEFLVGWRGRLFHIHTDFQVAESVLPYDACGCGSDTALGSLYSTEKAKMRPAKRIELALEAAEEFSSGVCRPFTIHSV